MKYWAKIALAFGVAVSAGCSHQPTLDEQIAVQEQTAKKLGWKLMPSQIAAGLRLDPEENAAIDVKVVLREVLNPDSPHAREHFQAGFKPSIKSNVTTVSTVLAQKAPIRSTNLESLRKSVKELTPYLDKFEASLSKPKWNFERKVGKAYATLLPDFVAYKSLAKCLAARAFIRGYDGDFRAIDDLRSMRKLSALLLQEPTMISGLVAIAVEGLAEKAATLIAQERPQNKAMIGKMAELWNAPQMSMDYRTLWCMDLASQIVSIDLAASEAGLNELGSKDPPASVTKVKPTRLRILKLGNETLQTWKGKPDDIELAMKVLKEPSLQSDQILTGFHPIFKSYLSTLNDGAVMNTLKAIKRTIAHERLIYLMLRMVQQGPSKGLYKLPAEASDKKWLDPYTGKKMLSGAATDGFMVYSVGANGVDDLGQENVGGQEYLDVCVTFKSGK